MGCSVVEQNGEAAVNVKRVCRVMRADGLLLQRHSGGDNGERVRIAFTLDCCGREAIS